jgi:outer membrane protein assembly factor BamB
VAFHRACGHLANHGLVAGYSSLAIANGRIYTQGQRDNQEYVLAIDVKTGKKLWEMPASRPYRNDRGDGPRGTPTLNGDRLYVMTGDGVLLCIETASGQKLWSKDLVREYGGSVPTISCTDTMTRF